MYRCLSAPNPSYTSSKGIFAYWPNSPPCPHLPPLTPLSPPPLTPCCLGFKGHSQCGKQPLTVLFYQPTKQYRPVLPSKHPGRCRFFCFWLLQMKFSWESSFEVNQDENARITNLAANAINVRTATEPSVPLEGMILCGTISSAETTLTRIRVSNFVSWDVASQAIL